jgi:RNA polymerase sigma-70 factor (ECF subfamily)
VTEGKLLPFRRVTGHVAELSDRALVSAVAAGDQAALGALYDRFHRDVFRFLARLARGADIDDFVQMTFLEAHRAAPRFRGDSAVKTWLFGIGANLVRTHARGEHRKRSALELLGTTPVAPGPGAGEAITLEQQRRWLASAVAALTPALREAYVLCVIEEVPGKEAAGALGIREASLWRRLTDARAALRAAIEGLQR